MTKIHSNTFLSRTKFASRVTKIISAICVTPTKPFLPDDDDDDFKNLSNAFFRSTSNLSTNEFLFNLSLPFSLEASPFRDCTKIS